MNQTAQKRLRKRVRENDYSQPRHGRCLLCQRGFDDCPHHIAEVSAVCERVRQEDYSQKWLS